nr:hypothetical protein [Tanacetum cinerariifolium]
MSVRGPVKHRISRSRWTAHDLTGPLYLCRGRSLGPSSLDYVPGPEHPPSPVYVLEFVLEHVYLEFMPPEDDVLPDQEQPLPAAVSPTSNSPGYISEFDLKEDPKEDPKEDDEDLEDDPADYPTNRDDDDVEEESSRDDVDDEEEEKDKEEEHPDLVDSFPPPIHRVTARMSVRAQTPISLPSETEVARLLTIPTPPPTPLSPLSSPLPLILSPLPQIPSPPLPISSHLPVSSPPLPARTPPLLPIPLPASSLPLLLPSTDCRVDVREVTLLPQKRFVGTLNNEIRQNPKREVGYGITDTWDEMVEDMLGTPAENGTKKNNEVNTSHNNNHHHYPMTNAQLKALIDQGVADVLAARNVDRSQNGEDNHDSGTGMRRQTPPTCQNSTCFECGAQGHFKREFPKLKNNDHGNQGRNGKASAKPYAVGHAGTNPYSNVVTACGGLPSLSKEELEEVKAIKA